MHITLVGDSVFDNAAYTSGAPSVSEHLAELIAPDGTVTLLALDGAVTSEVVEQLHHVPPATTHLLISSGGNDALQQIDLLTRPAGAVIPTAVSLFDDVIYRVAAEFGFPVIELRRVCREPADFVDAIEPSGSGGKKIAAAIASG